MTGSQGDTDAPSQCEPSRTWLNELSSDLVQFTDLFVVERSQLDKVMKEARLEQLGITESRVCQIHTKAVARLRSKLRSILLT